MAADTNVFSVNFDSIPLFNSAELDALLDTESLESRQKFTRELLQLFKANAELALSQLLEFYRQARWLEISQEAHKFKSGCYAIGGERLGRVNEEIESRARLAKDARTPGDLETNKERISFCITLMENSVPDLTNEIETYISNLK